MDLAQSLDKLSNKLDILKHDELLHLLGSLENMIKKTRDHIIQKSNTPQSSPSPTPESSSPQPPTSPLSLTTPHSPPSSPPSHLPPDPQSFSDPPEFQDFFRYLAQPLDDDLVDRVHEHLKGLTYHPNPSSPNSPEIYLYGEHSYIYNKQSAQVSPKATLTSLPMAELLIAVNGTLNTNYNSMLINRYRNLHCKLEPHKDDEVNLDPSSPISALSLGARRRFHVSLNCDKNKVVHTVQLASKSLCTMLPGFQDNYYHSIAPGRKSSPKEKGLRFSITFRRILPDTAEEEFNDKEKEDKCESSPVEKQLNKDGPDTLVFGSSLAKHLDDKLLSKYDKNFKVFSNSGAKVKDISADVKSAKEDKTLDLQKVTAVFFICGGNDIENMQKDSDIENVYIDYENLIRVAKDVFPAAKINVISLIPRRARYRQHINNMHEMNEWLEHFCHQRSLRFVNIFSHFIVKRPHIWELNTRLFNNRYLHFSKVGNSVLAKVLIGVANSPR